MHAVSGESVLSLVQKKGQLVSLVRKSRKTIFLITYKQRNLDCPCKVISVKVTYTYPLVCAT